MQECCERWEKTTHAVNVTVFIDDYDRILLRGRTIKYCPECGGVLVIASNAECCDNCRHWKLDRCEKGVRGAARTNHCSFFEWREASLFGHEAKGKRSR